MNFGWGRTPHIGGRLGAGCVLSGACCDAVPIACQAFASGSAGTSGSVRNWRLPKWWLWMPFATSCDGVLGSGF